MKKRHTSPKRVSLSNIAAIPVSFAPDAAVSLLRRRRPARKAGYYSEGHVYCDSTHVAPDLGVIDGQ